MRPTIWLLIFLFLSSWNVWAQTQITGSVSDEKGESIPGANISIAGTYDGTSTSIDGTFDFESSESGDQILLISFVGFKSHQQKVQLLGKPVHLEIVLREAVNQLDAVVISAGSFTAGEERRRTILKAVDIAMTAGATADVAGALNTLPGTTKVGESGRLFVRGGDGSETRTFIDGMLVLDAYSPSAPNTPSRGRFLPFMFKGTSFSTGGYSAEYGQALSSALVLNSKDKAEMNQTDIGILSVGADAAHTQVWGKSSFTGKIGYTDIRPYFSLLNQQVDWKNAPVSVEGSSAYRTKVGKDGSLKFFGNFNSSKFSLYNHDIQDPTITQLYDLSNNYAYGNGSYLQALNEKWTVRGGLSYTHIQNKIDIDNRPLEETENGIHTKMVFEHSVSDKVEISFGSEVIDRTYEAAKTEEMTNLVLKQTFRETLTSSFAEAQIYARNHLVAKAGARMEYNSLINQTSIDPRISMAYKPGTKGQFAFAYGKFRQTANNQYVRINKNLDSEKAEHFILNYQIITDKRIFRVETYSKNYDQLVKFQNANAVLPISTGKGYAKGVEFFWRDSKTLKNVDYWVSYSYLDTQRDYLNFPHASIPSFASKHNFSVVYKHFAQIIKSQFGFTYSYGSARTFNDPNTNEFNSGRTPSYQDLSANVAYLPRPNFILYVSATNLLGRDNIFGYQFAGAPDQSGVFAKRAIRQPATHFIFLGVFITISKNKLIGQLPTL